ncbi:MAG: hypothetical protein ABJL99_15060 [Aliishimia sp.]
MTTQPPVNLTQGIADTNEYGNKFNGNNNEDGIVSFAFQSIAGDLELTLSGYDVDFNDEVEVLLNGASFGFLTSGPNNALEDQSFLIAQADMADGENTISFVQALDASFAWGVTNVKIDIPVPEVEEPALDIPVANLTLGVTDTGIYGQRFEDARDEDGLVSYTFDGTGDDLVLTFDGYDLDSDGEMEVYLNGELVGPVSAGTDNGLSAKSIELAGEDLIVGENTVTFKQANNVAYIWGVTNVKIDTPVVEEVVTDTPVANLTLGVTDTGVYGQRFEDARDEDGLVSYTFDGTGDDLVLTFDGYDLDSDGEMELYLNGTLLAPVDAGTNNGLSSYSYDLAAGDLIVGENTVTFKQSNNVAYIWGVTNVKIDTPTPVVEEPDVDVPVADLTLGVTDTGVYGHRFEDARDADGLVSYTFNGTGGDLVLTFDGYDLDADGEMQLYLNGELVGPVGAGVDNGLNGYSYEFAAADLLLGENTVTFEQANNVAYVWGVTNVKIDTPTPVVEEPDVDVPVADLTLGVADTGIYGHRFEDARDADGLVSYTFNGTGGDLVLTFDGYDLDADGEMQLYLNGELVGPVGAGVDNGLNGYSYEFAAADLLLGENTVTFEQANNVAYVWGVTNVKIDTPTPVVEEPDIDVPVADLALGVTETGSYGHRFDGVKDFDGLVSFTFDSTGNDMSIDVDGFDIDSDGEVEVFLNGSLVGQLNSGPNNGFIAHSFDFAAGELLDGQNTVTFQQANDILYVWGVTNVTLSEVPNTVGTFGDDRIVGGDGDDVLFGNAGNDIFVFFEGGANDVITDFTLNVDVIELQNFGISEFSEIAISNDVDSNAVLTFGGTDSLTLTGIDGAALIESDFVFA